MAQASATKKDIPEEIVQRIQVAAKNKQRELDLSKLELKVLPEETVQSIGQLTDLRVLYLHGNQLAELPESIRDLTNLETLDLSENQLRSLPDAIGCLRSLKTLKLHENRLTQLPESIGQLIHLERLEVDSNQLKTLPESICNLESLQRCDLSNNQLYKLPESIGKLMKLRNLSLKGNQFKKLPDSIGNLANLQKLELDGNQLQSLPISIERLSKLQILSLGRNQLKKLSTKIGNLSSLQILDLRDNQLQSLPDALGQLANLQVLCLERNHLTKLPESVGKLLKLESLYLHENQLVEIPELIGNLSHLQNLYLHKNRISSLPESINELIKLEQLSLNSNQLTELPEEIGQLFNLQLLSLYENQLTKLPRSLQNLNRLEQLYLHGNQALDIPSEIFGPTYDEVKRKKALPSKPQEMLDYYWRIQKKPRPLNEAKLIFLGFGDVGKTSLVNRLVHNRFDPNEKKTEGIKVTPWKICLHTDENIKLNIWDFGGQEIMHSTHQLFLTTRSLYLLVLNGRKGHEDSDAEYWLSLIKSFGANSPVVIVLNKIEEHPFSINLNGLKQKFPIICGCIETDCKGNIGLNELRKMIEQQTDQLEDLRKEFPASWFDIKTHVAEMKENYITFDRYRDICKQYGETDFQAQDTLASHLHDLGIALNYKKDSRLRDTHVLNPSWVTNGIYTLINNSSLAKNKGEVKPEQLATILDPQNYPPERHLFLLELMRKFELCFRFPEEDDRYLIPDLLDKQQPQEVDEFKHEECLNFQYIYPISPERLLPRFIVRTRVLSTQELCWRTGVILQFEGCRALVKADRQDKRITITIDGKLEERRRLLGIIRSDFEHIHHSFAFEPEEKVPIPGHPKISVSYQDLLVLERDEVEQLPFVINGQIQKFSVKNLLNGVDFQRTQKPLKLFYIYSHKDEALRDQLATRLKLLERQGFIDSWHDRQITAGDEWREKLDKNLDQADIILLLISSDFLASDYCYEIEMKRALEKHNNSESIVIPIILRDCSWQQSPFGKLQALPENGKAITRWDDREEAWSSVEKGIQSIQLQQKTLLISRLKLENICCFSELNLELCSPQETPLFAIILGENGVGKTTLLRSIAIGLADEGEGIALISDAANNMIKENSDSASIVIELRSSISNRSYSITTLLKRDLEGTINLEKKYSPEFPRHQLFVCGYGAMRRGFGTGGYSNYTLAHAVKTLFDYGISLQNPELALRRIDAKGIPVTTLTSRIDGVLLLEPGSTSLDSSGIQISGPWGDFQPIATLGDGYQATLAWLADLLGWVLLYDHKLLTSKISGIVLIDELEQHLHPSWQRQIIEQLHQQFPDIQFIAATHSPVCAGGLADLEPDEATILRIYRDEKKCIQYEVIPSLAGYRYDQILTSDAFGLPSPRDATTEKLINRLRELYESSGSDSPEFQQVMDKLNDRSADAAEDEHDRQVRLKIAQDLEEFKNSSSQKPVV